MTLIVCLDDRNGLLFNNRRLSRDSALCDHILEHCGSKCLWMNPYSASIFPECASNIRVSENFLTEAGAGEFCFFENADLTIALKRANTLIVYRFNRSYPSDTKFPENTLAERKLISRIEFAGNSHPCITQEVYQ